MAESPTFSFLGGNLALDLVNTVHWRFDPDRRADQITHPAMLREWARQAGILQGSTGRPVSRQNDSQALRLAKELREIIFRVCSAVVEDSAPATSDLEQLEEFAHRLRLAMRLAYRDGGLTWEWKEGIGDLDLVVAAATRATLELLQLPQIRRIRRCSVEPCGWFFLDTTKNHSRRWCDMSVCGNREKARRYYRAHNR